MQCWLNSFCFILEKKYKYNELDFSENIREVQDGLHPD